MDLSGLLRRLEHEVGGDRDQQEILIMGPDGVPYEILSVNWDDAAGHWVIVGDYYG